MKMLSFHYFTLEPDKIIKQIEKKEKRAVEEHLNGLECEKLFINIGWLPNQYPSPHHVKLPDLEDALEQVVVKNWEGIVSVYPIIVTPYQENNLSWLMSTHDARKNSITQKYGSILVGSEAESLQLLFFIRGGVVFEKELYISSSMNCSGEYTLQRIATMDMQKTILLTDVAKQTECLTLDIPLMLPLTWEEIWTVEKRTRFVTFCK